MCDNSDSQQATDRNQEQVDTPSLPASARKDATFTISGTEFRTFRTHFMSSHEAAKAGYFSKSRWNCIGRDVCGVDQSIPPVDGPATEMLCVAKAWRTRHPADDDRILGCSQLNEYVVTNTRYFSEVRLLGCWPVFHKNQTQPKAARQVKEPSQDGQQHEPGGKIVKNSNTLYGSGNSKFNTTHHSSFSSTSTSCSSSSHDGHTIAKTADKSLEQKGLRQDQLRTRLVTSPLLTKKTTGRDIEVYAPVGFDWKEYPQLQPLRSSVMWFFHKLHERRFVNADGTVYGRDDFITIKSAYAREIDPNFRHAIKLLLELEIIERDYYEPDWKSYGYRFLDPKLRHARRRRVPLNDPKLARRIDRHRKKQVTTRTDRWLRTNLLKIGLAEVDEDFLGQVARLSVSQNGGTFGDKVECYRYVLERIHKQEHLWSSDDQGRRYSLITNLKRELRPLLLVEGKRLQQIDIANSQLTFLALEMRGHGVECSDFFTQCEHGQLYETRHVVRSRRRSQREHCSRRMGQHVRGPRLREPLIACSRKLQIIYMTQRMHQTATANWRSHYSSLRLI
jgi:hypothetical protein